MRLALEHARRALGRTSPNPPVGAVVVRDGKVVGVGHHARAGQPHAEAVALEAAGEMARGAELYVTLEPCDHEGRTPPCAPAVVAAGIRRVFVATIDPNPKVSGRGIRRLRDAGLEVEVGLLEAEAKELIEPWSKFIRTGRPYVIAKVAATLDGRIATHVGASRWITGEAARQEVHSLRSIHDAVLVGAGTVRADDPALTARIPEGRDPVRIVLSNRLDLSPAARVFREPGRTIVACVPQEESGRAAPLAEAGAEILVCRATPEGRIDVDDLLARLGAKGIVSVLVEGGAEVFSAFLAAQAIDRLLLYVAPKVFGAGPGWLCRPLADAPAQAPGFTLRDVRRVGEDLCLDLVPARSDAGRAESG